MPTALAEERIAGVMTAAQPSIPARPVRKHLSQEQIETGIADARRLEAQFDDVLRLIRLEQRHKTELYYCIDFHTIFSALEWFDTTTSESCWATLAFDLNASPMCLLPGSTYELAKYVRAHEAQLYQRSGSAILEAFVKAFQEATVSQRATPQMFGEVVAKLTSHALDGPSQRYLQQILKRLSALPRSYGMALEPSVFEDALAFFSRHRLDRSLNNRADSWDLATVAAMNRLAESAKPVSRRVGRGRVGLPSKVKRMFVMLSGSKLMQEAPAAGVTVVDPKVAALHQLFKLAGRSEGQFDLDASAAIARRVRGRARAWIEALDEGLSLSPTGEAFSLEDDVLAFITTIDAVQSRLSEVVLRRAQLIVSDGTSFDALQQQVYWDLARQTDAMLKRFDELPLYRQMEGIVTSDFEVKYHRDFADGHCWVASPTDANGPSVTVFRWPEFSSIQIERSLKLHLSSFLGALWRLALAATQDESRGILSPPLSLDSAINFVEISHGSRRRRIDWSDDHVSWRSVHDLERAASVRRGRMDAILISTRWFEGWIDRSSAGVSTNLPIGNLMHLFLTSLLSVESEQLKDIAFALDQAFRAHGGPK